MYHAYETIWCRYTLYLSNTKTKTGNKKKLSNHSQVATLYTIPIVLLTNPKRQQSQEVSSPYPLKHDTLNDPTHHEYMA